VASSLLTGATAQTLLLDAYAGDGADWDEIGWGVNYG